MLLFVFNKLAIFFLLKQLNEVGTYLFGSLQFSNIYARKNQIPNIVYEKFGT